MLMKTCNEVFKRKKQKKMWLWPTSTFTAVPEIRLLSVTGAALLLLLLSSLLLNDCRSGLVFAVWIWLSVLVLPPVGLNANCSWSPHNSPQHFTIYTKQLTINGFNCVNKNQECKNQAGAWASSNVLKLLHMLHVQNNYRAVSYGSVCSPDRWVLGTEQVS